MRKYLFTLVQKSVRYLDHGRWLTLCNKDFEKKYLDISYKSKR